jgi:hypothetical protein
VPHHHPLLVADCCSTFIDTAAFLIELATAAFIVDNNFVSAGICIGHEGDGSNPFTGFIVIGVITATTVFLLLDKLAYES